MDVDEAHLPYRWDLVTPDQLGTLLDHVAAPDLWFRDALTECAGKVVARSGGGDLVFVGRSLDSMYDLLSGATAGITGAPGLARLPFSFSREYGMRRGTWRQRPLTTAERDQARLVFTRLGLTPRALARRRVPVAFVDVVSQGSTFGDLYTMLRDWIDEERGQWDVIRKKLRFSGVTVRGKTSPNAFRWQQHAGWTRDFPSGAVVNVSLAWPVWTYLADQQVKLTRSHRPDRWLADVPEPDRDEKTRTALAEAVALVAYGRSGDCRHALARAMSREPALAHAWSRSLVAHLNA